MPMMKAILSLALVFAASSALACPADSKSADAKSAVNSSATAPSAKTAPTKMNVVDKKAVKPVEAKKPTT
jgi:hypothetical protein